MRECKRLMERHRVRMPVDIESLAKAEGLRVFYDKGLEDYIPGFLYRGEKYGGVGPTIVVNPHQPVTRQRFIIGHELGRYLLHQVLAHAFDERVKSVPTPTVDAEEIEANLFATTLLMPPSLVIERALAEWAPVRSRVKSKDELSINSAVVKSLAGQFGVSEKAMKHRLASLGFTALQFHD